MKNDRPRDGKTRGVIRSAIEGLERRVLLAGQLSFTAPPAAGAVGALGLIVVAVPESQPTEVTLSIASGPEGATLTGTTSVASSNGIAMFSGLSISTAGTYTLTADDGIDAPATSASFKLMTSQLGLSFFPEPTDGPTGMLAPVVVDVEKSMTGALQTADASAITLSITGGPNGATLGGTTLESAINGVATFGNLAITTPGTYSLMAADGSDTAATSTRFTLSVDQTDQLTFATQPVVTATGALNPITVDVENAIGNLLIEDNSEVTLAIDGGPSAGTLAGATTVAAVAGVATFTGLSVTGAGTYALSASDGLNSAATSNRFTYAVNQLVFSEQPQNATIGSTFSTVVVEVLSSTGSVQTSDDSSITLAIAAGPPGATIDGTTTAALSAVGGVATFSNLTFAMPGTYTLTATDGSDTAATSTTFTILSGYAYLPRVVFGSADPSVLDPNGGLTEQNGNLYGTTADGNAGSVFEVATDNPSLTTLATFDGGAELNPEAGLAVDSSGDVFGTTFGGGAYGLGEVFEIARGTFVPSIVASFDGADGSNPVGGLAMDSNGNLYGATESGGDFGIGGLFEVAVGSTSITHLAAFSGAASIPVNGVSVDSGGDVFGTTQSGGAGGTASVFEWLHGAPSITTLTTFNGAAGSQPIAAITVDSSGNVFGLAENIGTGGTNLVFEIPIGMNVTNLASFNGASTTDPVAAILDSGGNLYGATGSAVFELAPGATTVTFLASFSGIDGQVAGGLALQGSDGDLFGAFSSGYATNYANGGIFELTSGSQLAFSAEPDNEPASTSLGSIAVNVEESDGTTDTSDSSDVTLAIAPDPTGATLGGTTTVAAVNGVATFDVSISTPGTYTLIATDDADAYATSTTFTVGNQLAFSGPIPNAATGPLGTIEVNVENAGGTITSELTQPEITLAIPGNPDALTGTTTATAVAGVATFNNLSITTPGTYTLVASDGIDINATSTSFTLGDQLVFSQQPVAAPNGALGQFTVEAEDFSGNLLIGDNSQITIASVPPDVLTGTTTVQAVNGIAKFTGLSIMSSGAYVLTATAATGNDAPATSQSFSYSQPSLRFLPSPAYASNDILAPITVDIDGSGGNLLTDDSSDVTLSVASPAGATLGGLTTVEAVDGVAAFDDLNIKAPGAYTLVATDADDKATSAETSFADNVPIPAFARVVLPPTIVYGSKSKATVAVGIANTGSAPDSKLTVELHADPGASFDPNQLSMTSLTGKIAVLKSGRHTTLRFSAAKLLSILGPGDYHLVAEVIDPSGIVNYAVTTQTVQVLAESPGTPLPGAGGNFTPTAQPLGVIPTTLRQYYGVDGIKFGSVTGDGAGQTIAIIGTYSNPYALSDLEEFDKVFNLPDPPKFTQINGDGGALPPPPPIPRRHNGTFEESIDVQYAHAMAPEANIVEVEIDAFQSSFDNAVVRAIRTAENLPSVDVVSMSFGYSVSAADKAFNSVFTTPQGHKGITFLAASGDDGGVAEYPSTAPGVVAVGGTVFDRDNSNQIIGESAWDDSGGGRDPSEPEPAFQQGTVTQPGSGRATPDVAMDAGSAVPVCDSYDFGSATPWVTAVGTSLACPLWAGLIAIADQGREIARLPSLNGPTQTLPRLYALPASDFHDITTGSSGYAAGPGYDLATGLGTPIANTLVPDLAKAARLSL